MADESVVYVCPELFRWEEHIEIYALGMEGDKFKRDWRPARPLGEHTTGFLLAYDSLEEYYECHDKEPIVLIRRKDEGNKQLP